MISYQPGVNLESGSRELWAIIGWLRSKWDLWFGEELVITSLDDGDHRAGSLHYGGRAVDVRTRKHFNGKEHSTPMVHFAKYIQERLGPRGVRVVLHPDWVPGEPHLHVGFLLKGDEQWAIPVED